MSKSMFCLAAALVSLAAPGLVAPAKACEALPQSASLCTIVSASADVRDQPDGRVEYVATGKVEVTGRSGNGLWARIEVPCVGYEGWIASQDLICEGAPASAQAKR
ncbi:MAG TPA: SH3 domain-containing protein [Methylocella sp.]|nr:SH3 domain-containing protein [Methylocella sp.]